MRLVSLGNLGNASLLLLIAGCCGPCCIDKDTALDTADVEVDTDTDTDTDTATDTDADTDVVEGVHGTINGNVTVTLFEYDEDGNIIYLAWGDTCFGDLFPYGDIFVTAYATDEETGAESYYADDTIVDPSVEGSQNTFSLPVDTDEQNEIYVYAVLDKWFNLVIEPGDPIGIYSQPLVLEGGETTNDVNIEILTQYWCGFGDGSACPDCPPSWGSGSDYYWDGTGWVYTGSGGGGCTDTITVGGALEINTPYNGTGSDVGTMLLYPGTEALWWLSTGLSVTGNDEGAEGQWGYSYCNGAGSYVARGVWDDNANGLYDPSDTWGQAVDDDGVAQNHITFGEEDDDVTMMIPVEGSGFDLVPFVRITGNISRLDGTWDELVADNPDARIYVVANKYLESMQAYTSSFEDAYDYDVFEPDDLVGATDLGYSLLVPANISMYLFAAGDLDNDGYIDGALEGWACGGEDDCWVASGTSNQTGVGMGMDFTVQDTGE